MKIIIAAVLIACVFTQEEICRHLGFGQAKHHETSSQKVIEKEKPTADIPEPNNYFVSDTIYHWDMQMLDWVVTKDASRFNSPLAKEMSSEHSESAPIEIQWKVLMEIQYRLRYFSELDMEMYAPVFPSTVKALNGRRVIIEGFVIPFEDEEGVVSLSYNPFASCFFCGAASPASVMSMYLVNKRKRYKIDDFKKFEGTLYLNEDDPDELYYILKDAKEV